MTIAADLSERLKAEAGRLGFDRVGIAPAVAPPGYEHFRQWLRLGYDAGMTYMRKHEPARADPGSVLEGVRSIVVAAMVYGGKQPSSDDPSCGKVARYARGADYHEVLWSRLGELQEWLVAEIPGIRGRAVADTAPLLEREYARLAGLGWIGKNTMLIDRRIGSFTVLGALLVDGELVYDPPLESSHCGTCTRCLDACPTRAFDGPYRLDANRCLSYWTIEHRGDIPDPIAESLDGWAFGCDVCQDVCPWNRKAPETREPKLSPRPEWTDPDMIAWLKADPGEFRRGLKGTALARAKRSGLLRNAALILGQRRIQDARDALSRLRNDDDPVVRNAVEWALARIDGQAGRSGQSVAPGNPAHR